MGIQDVQQQELNAIFEKFKRDVEALRGKHRAAIAEILKKIDERHMAEIKKSLGIT